MITVISKLLKHTNTKIPLTNHGYFFPQSQLFLGTFFPFKPA